MSCGDYNGPTVFSENDVKARKPHRCCECYGRIEKGEEYNRVDGLWDGEWRSFATCGDCKAMRCDMGCECYEFGDLEEQIGNMDCPIFIARFRAVQKSRGIRRGAA